MITTTNLNSEELEIMQFGKKDTKAYVVLFLKIFTPLSFLLGLLGLLKKGNGYWPTTVFFLSVFLFTTVYLIIKEQIQFSKDIKEQLKYVGTVAVVKKSGDNDCKIYTDSKELKKINIDFPSLFNQINVGDVLYLEVAKSSKFIFKLNKGDISIINRS